MNNCPLCERDDESGAEGNIETIMCYRDNPGEELHDLTASVYEITMK